MDPDRWKQVEELYHAAVGLEESRRAAFLEQACAGDEALRRRVESLLAHYTQASSRFLEEHALEVAAKALAEDQEVEATSRRHPPVLSLPATEGTAVTGGTGGTVIGRYHLLEKAGEGGMGEVWLAEQKKPVRRRVALKLVKAGMNTRDVIARFESERQALALMDHPAIAKVFDAGSTPQGAPYF